MRHRLSVDYANGSGLEIGAFFHPWPMHSNAEIRYCDSRTRPQLAAWATADKAVGEDKIPFIPESEFICSAENLNAIENDRFDFVVASHVLEHCFDPIEAIENWLRVLKIGGYILMAVPIKNFTFDKDRPITSTDSLIFTYTQKDEAIRMERRKRLLREDRSMVHKMREPELTESVESMAISGEDVHFNVWDVETFHHFISCLPFAVGFNYDIVEMIDAGAEYFAVLRRTK